MNTADAAAAALAGGTAAPGGPRKPARPWTLRSLLLVCALLVLASLFTLAAEDELGLGRKPWQNLQRTVAELSEPSFLRLWFGNPRLEVRDGDVRLLRVEDQRETEARDLAGVGRALWTALRIATLGTAPAARLRLPLGLLAARTLGAPRPLAWAAKAVLNALRSVHTLVFGLLLVGIAGLGATAGILAVALHSTGTLGKLLAESI